MNYSEALKILGLNNNYTEDELRKSYYALAKQYHPDALINKTEAEKRNATEKLKKINEAYEVLSKALKEEKKDSNSYNANTVDEELKAYKIFLKEKILSYYPDSAFFKEFSSLATMFVEDIGSFIAKGDGANTTAEVKNILNEFLVKVAVWYGKFRDYYFDKYFIEDTPFTINSKMSIKEFYESLKRLRENNSFLDNITKIIESYKQYPYYDVIKDDIEKLKDTTYKEFLRAKCRYNNRESLDSFYLHEFKKVVDARFKKVTINYPLYKGLMEKAKAINFESNQLGQLQDVLLKPLFPIYYQEYFEMVNHKWEVKNYNLEINTLFGSLTERYNTALANSNNAKHRRQISMIFNLIKSNMETFLMGKEYGAHYESIKLLDKIDFTNYDLAAKILDVVTNNLITDQYMDIYIYEGKPVKYIVMEDEEYEIWLGEVVSDEIVREEKPPVKIPLDKFMYLAQEFFAISNLDNDDFVCLYRFGSTVLGLCKGRLEFCGIKMLDKCVPQDKKNLGIYQNKGYVRSLLINQYYRDIQKYRENKESLEQNKKGR